ASIADGALSDCKGDDDSFDEDRALALLKTFWRAVRRTWPDAWGLPSNKSRLTHAAGVQALGVVMDKAVERHHEKGLPTEDVFAEELSLLVPHCHWTDGEWKFSSRDKRPWNVVSSTPKDVETLKGHMRGLYKTHVRVQK